MNFKLYTCTILGMLSFGFQGHSGGENPDASFEKEPMMDGMPMDEGMDNMAMDDMEMNDMSGPSAGGMDHFSKGKPDGKDLSSEPKEKEGKHSKGEQDGFGAMPRDVPSDALMDDKAPKMEAPTKPKNDGMNDMAASNMPTQEQALKPSVQEQVPGNDLGGMSDMDAGGEFDDFGPDSSMDDFGGMGDMDEFAKMDGDMMPSDMNDDMMDDSKGSIPPVSKDMNPKSMSDSMDADMAPGMDDQLDKQPDNFQQ